MTKSIESIINSCMSWACLVGDSRSKNDFNPPYILVEVEGRAQYSQPLRLGDCHRGIELRTVCGELRARKTRYAICTTIPECAAMTMMISGERDRERFNA